MTARSEHDQPPTLIFAAGSPSAEEIAAVVTALSARMRPAGTAGAGETARSGWSARSRLLRAPVMRSPGGWRASALPR
jgi:hypothetical protein